MEEIVIQALLEIGLQILGEIPWEVTLRKDAKRRQEKGRPGLDDAVVSCSLLSLLVGFAVGGISLWLLPSSFLHAPWLRAANLLVSPLLTGTLSCLIAAHRRKTTSGTSPLAHFVFSFLFSLSFALVRFLCIAR